MSDTLLAPADCARLQAICDGNGPDFAKHAANKEIIQKMPAALATIRRYRELLERCRREIIRAGHVFAEDCPHDDCKLCPLTTEIKAALEKE